MRGQQMRIAPQGDLKSRQMLLRAEEMSHMALEALNEAEPLWTKIVEKGISDSDGAFGL